MTFLIKGGGKNETICPMDLSVIFYPYIHFLQAIK